MTIQQRSGSGVLDSLPFRWLSAILRLKLGHSSLHSCDLDSEIVAGKGTRKIRDDFAATVAAPLRLAGGVLSNLTA